MYFDTEVAQLLCDFQRKTWGVTMVFLSCALNLYEVKRTSIESRQVPQEEVLEMRSKQG